MPPISLGMGCAVTQLGTVFSPLSLSPALWLDAADQSTLYQERTGASATTLVASDADPIGTWKDKSGNARHVTAPTDAARPTFKTGIQNGRSIARFDGTDDYLRITGLSAYSSPVSVSMVIIPTVPGSGSKTIFDGQGVNQHSLLISSGLVWNVRTQNSGTNENVSSYVSTTPYIVTWILNGTGNSTFSRNGTSTSLSQNHLVSSTGYTIGARADGSVPAACDIGEVIVYHVQLSTSQRQQVERYLGNKWGISVA
jgi:hypothetical protein